MRNLTDLLLFFVMAIWLAACQHSTLVGDDLIDEDNTQIQEIDTLGVETGSVLLDSVYTSDGTRLLAGAYQDPYLGEISAACFFNLDTIGNFSIEDDDNLRFDSLSLSLRQDYAYPATNHLQRLAVYALDEALDEETFYFNDAEPIGVSRKLASAYFNTRITQSKRFNVRLPDDLGQSLFRLAKDQVDIEIEEVLKGLKLVQDGSSEGQSVMGFATDSMEVRLYYQDRRTGEAGTIELGLKPGRRFNRISGDRSATSIRKLTQVGIPVSSRLSNGESYIQAGVGICTKIDFPTLRSIRQNRTISINLAYLDIQPLKNSYQGSDLDLPNNLHVYAPTHKNTLKETYWYNRDFNPVNITRTVNPLTGNTNYRIYLTDYIHDIINQDTDDYEGILLYTPAYSTGINEVVRMVLPSQQRSRDAIKLHVIFTVIK